MEHQITCRVCETVQPNAWYCATCGMPLHTIPSPEWVDPPPQGFEPTQLDEANVEAAPVPGLEVTRYDDVPELASLPVPGLEHGSETPPEYELLTPVIQPVPGFEPTSDTFETTPIDPQAAVRCEWCGYPQASGRVCDYCGRARTRVLRSVEGEGDDESLVAVCGACGARGANGRACPVCGEPAIGLE